MKKRICLIVFMLLALNVFSVFGQEDETNYVISLPGNQIDPNVWGRYIVYLQDLGNNKYDIYAYDSGDTLSKGDDVGVSKITQDGKDTSHSYSAPVINGKYIAWLDNNQDIYVYDMGEDGIINGNDLGKKKLTLTDTDPSETRSYQAGTKENLEISDGVLVWEEYEMGGSYDIRGYNLNTAGEANPLNPKDLHYLQIADKKSVTFGANSYPINERDPYIAGNMIVYTAENYKDLGEFGVEQSVEIYKTQLDSLSNSVIVSREGDGCSASEPSIDKVGRTDILWIESCPNSRVIKNRQQVVVENPGDIVYHSPLTAKGEDNFYIKKDILGQLTLSSGEGIADTRMDIDKYQLVYTVKNADLDIGVRSLKLLGTFFGKEECVISDNCPNKDSKYCNANGDACFESVFYSCIENNCILGGGGRGCQSCIFGCDQGACLDKPLSCSDGILSKGESDIDCGGDFCGKCDIGKKCYLNIDCNSGKCENNICVKSDQPNCIGEAVPLFSAGNRIYLNDPLNQYRTIIGEALLPEILATLQLPSGAKYKQEIQIGNYPKVVYGRMPMFSNDPAFGLQLSATVGSNYLYKMNVNFDSEVDFVNMGQTNTGIKLFGREFSVSPQTDNTKLVLLESIEITLTDTSPSQLVEVDGKMYIVEVVDVTDTSANIKVTNEMKNTEQKEIIERGINKINRLIIELESSDESNSAFNVILNIVGTRINLVDGSSVTIGVNEDVLDGTLVNFDGGVSKMKGFSISVTAPDSDHDALLPGQEFIDPVFGSFKVYFAGLNIADNDLSLRENIKVANNGDNKMDTTITDIRGNTKTFQWAISPTADTIELQKDEDGKNIVVFERGEIYRNEYVVVGNEKEGRLLKVSSIVNQAGYTNDKVRFIDVFSGETYDTAIISEGVGTVTVAGKVYGVNYYGASNIAEDLRYIRLNYPDSIGANTAIIYPTIESSKGAKIAFYKQIKINLNDWNGNGNSLNTLRFPNGNGYTDVSIPKTAGRIEAKVGELNYNIIVDASQNAIIYNGIGGIEKLALIIFEEKDDNTQYQALAVILEAGNTASDGIGVRDVIKTWSKDFGRWRNSMASDSRIVKDADLFGSIITMDYSDSDQINAIISYPDEQVYPMIFVVSADLKCTDLKKRFIRGDIDNSGVLDLTDAVTLLGYLYQAGKEPSCKDAADVDDTGIIDLSDVIYLLNRLFMGGAAIPAPANSVGEDPTQDGLDCACYGFGC